MHRACSGALLALAVVLSNGCVSEEPPKAPTPIASLPTLARPPLTTPSIFPSMAIPFPSPSPSTALTAAGQTYTVQSGDTLSSISSRLYGDASETAWRPIFEANRDKMDGPGSLSTGMVLRIPPPPPTPTPQRTPQR